MFDLEQSIADWRKQMLAVGIQTPVPLEELEIHLREEIEQQIKLRLNAQQAFEAAVQKIGQVYVLKTEFAKIGGIKSHSLTSPNRIFSTLFVAFAVTFLVALLVCPPISKMNGEAYFTLVSYPDPALAKHLSGAYYDLNLDAFRGEGHRIDVPVWFVDLLLFVGIVGAGILAFRHPRRRVCEMGGQYV